MLSPSGASDTLTELVDERLEIEVVPVDCGHNAEHRQAGGVSLAAGLLRSVLCR